MQMSVRMSVAASMLLLAGFSVRAENWPQWRGPAFNGSSSETNLPATFSKTENLKWTTPMPGRGNGTPAIWDDRVFVTSTDATTKDLLALCLDRKDGKVLWKKVVVQAGDKAFGRNSHMGSPSPITDGKMVIFFYGTGDIVAYDFEGKELWKRNLAEKLGKFAVMWGYGSSGLLYKDKLYIPVLQRDTQKYVPGADLSVKLDSYIVALDPKTGNELWKHVRPCDAVEETRESYATPIPLEGKDGSSKIVMIGGDCVTAHNSENGEEIWRFGGWNPTKINHVRLVPSVAVFEDLVYAATPKHLFPFFAIKDGGKGDVTSTNQAWTLDKSMSPDVCTPLIYKGLLYVLDGDGGKRTLTCMDPKTGQKKWSGQLPGKATYWASATGADDKIYVINEASDVTVVAAGGSEFKQLHTVNLGDTVCYSTIPVAHGQIFVRTGQNLYCFGK